MSCSFKNCKSNSLDESECRIEAKTVLPKREFDESKLCIRWRSDGEAKFHKDCWNDVLKLSRSRAKKKDGPNMSHQEKVLVKEAAKSFEQFDSFQHVCREAKRVAKMITSSKHCVAFTGAGISTSAGIGDYRGKSGKWTEMDQNSLDVDSVFEKNEPETKKRKTQPEATVTPQTGEEDDDNEGDGVPYESLRPTYTHEALYKLLQDGYLHYIISQNGDGLHGLSGVPQDAISELHGNVFIERCESCGKRYERDFYVMDDISSQYYEELEDYGKTDIRKPKHAVKCKRCGLCHRTGRKCEKKGCRGYLIDSIINFRDHLEDEITDRATANASQCDLMLCLGTTLMVTPASDFVELGKHPLRLVICNRQETYMDSVCAEKTKDGQQLGSRVFGDCDVFFREVMKHILDPESLKRWEDDRGKRMKKYDKHRS
ncbi:NAD-dependent protein deacetylase Sirt6-like [Ylistrum balloti]|uniref:NAD-dependent protein deacetylase Sirt6-like n=1 Tax=Ylistrum balloti TaxID=509963 RepID=UPI002905E8E7|nr:NAD-dependent protein deacetylase Sirt6-like [Ylistrum balloti]